MKRKREDYVSIFDGISASDEPQMVSGMLLVGQDFHGYEYYTKSNGEGDLSSVDSKHGINRIKKLSKSMTTAQDVDVVKLSEFLENMSPLCENGDIVGLSIFKYEVNSRCVFNAEVYSDYTVEESLSDQKLDGVNTNKSIP